MDNTQMKIGFVVLNYGTYHETVNCVRDIEGIKKAFDVILIVDNASPDGSGRLLLERFDGRPDIEVLLLEENLGFARGNNAGIKLAREKYNCDFVAVMNSDILIPKVTFGDDADKQAYGIRPDGSHGLLEKDELAPYLEADQKRAGFRELLLESYEAHKMAVIGPRIYGVDGNVSDSSPKTPIYTTLERVQKGMKRNKIRFYLSFLGLDRVPDLLAEKKGLVEPKLPCDVYCEQVRLAGCFLVFTPVFFEALQGFFEETFLYLEEDILYYQVQAAGLTMAYEPSLKVIHLEDCAAVGVVRGTRNGSKLRRFRYKNQMQSFEAFSQLLKG